MAASAKLPRLERLRSDKRIDALFKAGRWGHAEPLKYCWVVTGEPEEGGRDGLAGGSCGAGSLGSSEVSGVSILVAVPKKSFKRAWKRNLIKRRIKESYRQRKEALVEVAVAAGRRVEVAFICSPLPPKGVAGGKNAVKSVAKSTAKSTAKKAPAPEIPDFKSIDNAIAKIIAKIASAIRA